MNHNYGRTLALQCQLVESPVLSTVAVLAFLVDCVCAVPGWHGRNDCDACIQVWAVCKNVCVTCFFFLFFIFLEMES